MGGQHNRTGWRFGSAPYELIVNAPWERSVLTRAGILVALTDLEMRLLVLIVGLCGGIASKADQLKLAWGGTVGEGSMATALSHLREKLIDDIIQTVYRAGLRLACWIEAMDSPEELLTRFLIKLFTHAILERQTMSDEEWDRKYARWVDDIRASFAWVLAEPGRRFLAVDLFGATGEALDRFSLHTEARGYVERILPLIDEDIPDQSAARFFLYAGLMWRETNRRKALSFFQRSAKFYLKLNDSDNHATVLGKIGGTRTYLGQLDKAEDDLEEAVKQLSKTDRNKDLYNALNDLGLLYAIKNLPDFAKASFDRAIEVADSFKDIIRKNITIMNLGEMEWNKGAEDRAMLRWLEADKGLESAPNTYRLRPKVNLAMGYTVQGDLPKARFYALKALALLSDGDGYWGRLDGVVLALLAAENGEPAYAAQLLGALTKLMADSGEAWAKIQQQVCDKLMKILEEKLSAESLKIWLSEGARWTETKAMAFVQSHIIPAIPTDTADEESK